MSVPMQMIARVSGLKAQDARRLAGNAVKLARSKAPKLSGQSAKRFTPVYGAGFFGVRWADSYVFFQERGIGAFTMKNLSGKTIPMWIDDPTGTERRKNPNAETRVTASGKQQILIFRKAGTKGDTKRVKENGKWKTVPNYNYPGGPGRIGLRQAAKPFTNPGKIGGQIAKGNVGVRWRHPGIQPRGFLQQGIKDACLAGGVIPSSIVAVDQQGNETPVE